MDGSVEVCVCFQRHPGLGSQSAPWAASCCFRKADFFRGVCEIPKGGNGQPRGLAGQLGLWDNRVLYLFCKDAQVNSYVTG